MSSFINYVPFNINTLLNSSWGGVVDCINLEILIPSSNIYPVLVEAFYKSTNQFKTISDIIAYDMPGKTFRYSLVYLLVSYLYNVRLKVITKLKESDPVIVSSTPLYSGSS